MTTHTENNIVYTEYKLTDAEKAKGVGLMHIARMQLYNENRYNEIHRWDGKYIQITNPDKTTIGKDWTFLLPPVKVVKAANAALAAAEAAKTAAGAKTAAEAKTAYDAAKTAYDAAKTAADLTKTPADLKSAAEAKTAYEAAKTAYDAKAAAEAKTTGGATAGGGATTGGAATGGATLSLTDQLIPHKQDLVDQNLTAAGYNKKRDEIIAKLISSTKGPMDQLKELRDAHNHKDKLLDDATYNAKRDEIIAKL